MGSKISVLFSQVFIKLFSKAEGISDENYNRILYALRTGKRANIKNPKTLNENILSRKIYADEDWLTQYTDKYEVRKYVESVIGSNFLVENYGIWDSADKIDLGSLPNCFVLKATHGSGWNVVVKDKVAMDWRKTKKRLSAALRSNYYYKSRERNYKNIQPRILCERLLTPTDARGLIDFKVFCFHGKGKFFSVSYQLDGRPYYGLYLIDGQKIENKNRYRDIESSDIPKRILDILPLAEKLAAPFEFVRVDFYLCDEELFFSELTFHSGGGIVPIEPVSVDKMLGAFFEN